MLIKSLLALGALSSLSIAASAWAGYNIWSNEYTFTQQQLQTTMARKFPLRLRYAEVFNVDLKSPQLSLNSPQNRVVTLVNVSVVSPLLLPTPLNGTITLSSRLKYDRAARAIRLDSPTVDTIDFSSVPPQYKQQLNQIGAVVAEQVLKDYPIYTFTADELRLNGKTFEPGEITVQTDGIAVQINET
ncbi:putative transmembrane protein [Collimonas arenae]|uniref:Putative transmembrane protein n=2 Tax=Collimonas arenae TaxID=279058 RepID=A0A0A1F8D3_9BURK|nr:putative transmembrane protein [Collimonas arenae]